MGLRDYYSILREWWLSVLLFTLVGTLAAGVLTLNTDPQYRSTSQIYVSVQTQDGSTQNLVQGSTFTQSQVAGFADLATSPLVLDPIIANLGLEETANSLGERVSGTAAANTALIDVAAVAATPAEAAALSNAVAESMATVLPELQRPLDSAVSPVRITLTRPAVTPEHAVSPNSRQNLVLGLLAGLAAGISVAILRSTLDTRIRTTADVEGIAKVALLGAVGLDPSATSDPLVVATAPLSRRAEEMRRIRTNLKFVGSSAPPQSIVVTSSLPGEGKSTTAANLALAVADTGSRVLLIDGDLRRPTVARVFGLEGAVGLTTLLIGGVSLEDAVQPFSQTSLDIITAGEIPPNPSELLGSERMRALLEGLREIYDFIIIDSAPLLPVTDGAVLSRMVDGAIVVIGASTTRKNQVSQALRALETVQANVLGVVLNRTTVRALSEYRYYEYGSAEQPRDTKTRLKARSQAKQVAPRPNKSAKRRSRSRASDAELRGAGNGAD